MYTNAFFLFSIKDDGLYVKLYPPVAGGKALTIDDIQQYMDKIIKFSPNATVRETLIEALLIQQEQKEIKLSEVIFPHIDEAVTVSVSQDKMAAHARFYAASEQGAQLDKDSIVKSLSDAGVVYGIIEETVSRWLDKKLYCTDFLIAEGTPPERSRDAFIEYKFETEKVFNPTIDEKGVINFHQLNLLNNVVSGDVLAVLTPAYQGAPGTNLLGASIPSMNPVNKSLKYGKNVELSEDSLALISTATGHVDMAGDKVIVHNVYEIKGDVGVATGDVDYDGIVKISGDVLTGYSVKATIDIYVQGVVEGANITAGGNVAIANGVHGGDRASIVAGGDVAVKYLEGCVISAEGNVVTSSTLHSNITANGSILVGSSQGLVKGGELYAKELISVKTVGSDLAGARVLLRSGALPEAMESYLELEKTLASKQREYTLTKKTLEFLSNKVENGKKLLAEQEQMMIDLPNQREALEAEIGELSDLYDRLKTEMEMDNTGKIVIEGTIHEGTVVAISNAAYNVQHALKHCQFEKRGTKIEITSL